MNALVIAIHGILTSQTDPSWPDRFDAWMYGRDREVKVLKKEYAAGPFPRWNCWVKDPRLARSLANELELFLTRQATRDASRFPLSNGLPSVWFVAHSNGAVIALLAAKRLIARGWRIGGLILTGAACEADLDRSAVLTWLQNGQLGAAIAYCSADDLVLDGAVSFANSRCGLRTVKEWFWGKLMWPYGCLGRTGWMRGGETFPPPTISQSTPGQRLFTRWFPGGHTSYFQPANLEHTFEQIYRDIQHAERRQEQTLRPQLRP